MNDARVDRIETALTDLTEQVHDLGDALAATGRRSNLRIDGVEAKIDTLDAKVDAMGTRLDSRIDGLAARSDERFREVEVAFEEQRRFTLFVVEQSEQRLRQEMRERFDGVDRRFDGVDRRFDELDRRFDELDRRFDHLEARLFPDQPS